jgi:hypothetical protein
MEPGDGNGKRIRDGMPDKRRDVATHHRLRDGLGAGVILVGHDCVDSDLCRARIAAGRGRCARCGRL